MDYKSVRFLFGFCTEPEEGDADSMYCDWDPRPEARRIKDDKVQSARWEVVTCSSKGRIEPRELSTGNAALLRSATDGVFEFPHGHARGGQVLREASSFVEGVDVAEHTLSNTGIEWRNELRKGPAPERRYKFEIKSHETYS